MREKIAKLINVKSIGTILLTIAYIVLTFLCKITPEYQTIYVVVISFYFGTQHEKNGVK